MSSPRTPNEVYDVAYTITNRRGLTVASITSRLVSLRPGWTEDSLPAFLLLGLRPAKGTQVHIKSMVALS